MGLLLLLILLALLFGGLGFAAHIVWVLFLVVVALLIAGALLDWFSSGPRV